MSLAYTRGIAPGSTKWRTWCREGSGGICRTRLLSVVVSKTLGSSFVNKTTKKKIERPNLLIVRGRTGILSFMLSFLGGRGEVTLPLLL